MKHGIDAKTLEDVNKEISPFSNYSNFDLRNLAIYWAGEADEM